MAETTDDKPSPADPAGSPSTAHGPTGTDWQAMASSLEQSAEEAQQALRGRPSISIRRRLSGGFLLWFLSTVAIVVVSILLMSRIETKLEFLEAATNYTVEIQQARRFEKNYFLYHTNLADAREHVQNAHAILHAEGPNIAAVVGDSELDRMADHLRGYEQLLVKLQETDPTGSASQLPSPLTDIEQELRRHGGQMIAVAEELLAKERGAVAAMLLMSQRIPLAFLVVLVLLMLYFASFISRQVVSPLNRMMAYTRRIAEGDFTPITPKRKFHDEFSELALAMNQMMYQLVYRQELLMKAHKLKAVGTLTAGVAHELNNPINNIILTASMLQEEFGELSQDECLELVADLVGESERAQKIVRNLLDFARESDSEMESHNVQAIVEKTLALARNQIKLAKVKVEGELENGVAPIYGDRQQLEQVFLNLVLNALDAMPNGGLLKIRLQNTKDREQVAVSFEDTGVGIPKQHLSDVFDPFFTSKKAAKGTGLGLSVSLGIVQKHGGDIRVDSEVGKGTCFTVLLPVAKVPADIGGLEDDIPAHVEAE